uniref:HtrA serine peptidase 4 n=1 Tax=Sinocyclocheilus rhinocerous TaxID=307959 RepID=A0A673MRU7_9TELE
MWRLLACVLMASVLQARDLRTRQTTCPNVCDLSRCSSALKSCYFGVVKDRCDCCTVCAAGEGEYCGDRGHVVCGQGMTCEYRSSARGTCVCDSQDPVCGSNGRTYPSVCRLKAENRRDEMSGIPAVIFIQRACNINLCSRNPSSMRYKFNFIADVVDKIAPAVVHLELFSRLPFSNQDVPVSSGSGFIVSEDGWIITNAHVLTNKQHIKVELKNGMLYDATIKDVDQKLDIALIKIDSETPLQVLLLGRSSELRPGEFVVAVGSPFSLQNTVTTGIISTTHRGGGPLVNLVRTFYSPVSYLALKKESNFPDVSSGVYVYEVIPGTAAFSAGLVNQDVIIKDMSQAVQSNEVLSLVVRHANEEITLTVVPDEVD